MCRSWLLVCMARVIRGKQPSVGVDDLPAELGSQD